MAANSSVQVCEGAWLWTIRRRRACEATAYRLLRDCPKAQAADATESAHGALDAVMVDRLDGGVLPMATDSSLPAPAIIVVALVLRTALGEVRHPEPPANNGRLPPTVALGQPERNGSGNVLPGWQQAGPALAAWALLIGVLTAYLGHRARRRP